MVSLADLMDNLNARVKSLDEILKARKYLKSGGHAPEGVKEYTGTRGGRYYLTEDVHQARGTQPKKRLPAFRQQEDGSLRHRTKAGEHGPGTYRITEKEGQHHLSFTGKDGASVHLGSNANIRELKVMVDKFKGGETSTDELLKKPHYSVTNSYGETTTVIGEYKDEPAKDISSHTTNSSNMKQPTPTIKPRFQDSKKSDDEFYQMAQSGELENYTLSKKGEKRLADILDNKTALNGLDHHSFFDDKKSPPESSPSPTVAKTLEEARKQTYDILNSKVPKTEKIKQLKGAGVYLDSSVKVGDLKSSVDTILNGRYDTPDPSEPKNFHPVYRGIKNLIENERTTPKSETLPTLESALSGDRRHDPDQRKIASGLGASDAKLLTRSREVMPDFGVDARQPFSESEDRKSRQDTLGQKRVSEQPNQYSTAFNLFNRKRS